MLALGGNSYITEETVRLSQEKWPSQGRTLVNARGRMRTKKSHLSNNVLSTTFHFRILMRTEYVYKSVNTFFSQKRRLLGDIIMTRMLFGVYRGPVQGVYWRGRGEPKSQGCKKLCWEIHTGGNSFIMVGAGKTNQYSWETFYSSLGSH